MMDNLILKKKQTEILILIKNSAQDLSMSTISKLSNTTYVHVCNFLATCEYNGITTSEKHGKLKIIKLTDKGLRITNLIISINSELTIAEQQRPPETPK
ncbi:MAG: hypothetical protein ABR981_00175 [Candidatus Micrarchaeaceae archaeon]|jgi:predicted transcriptional regulator